MKKNDLISIIVPVYNVSKYLEKCVYSIVNQTYNNIEIILVDDGSSDDSGKKCDSLSKIDNRIKVFHKENGGLSDARNYGIDKSMGKYVCFVDSDDFVTIDMCEILYNDILKYKTDVSCCTYIDYYDDKTVIKNDDVERYKVSKEEAIRYVMIGDKIPISAVAKLYKKSIFDEIKFEKNRAYEDALIMIELFDKCKNISINTSKVYYYVHRKNSITTSKYNKKRDCDVIFAYEKNKSIIEKKYPDMIEIANMRLCWAYFHVLDNMIRSNYKNNKEIVKYLRDNYTFIMKSKYFTKSRKISMFFLKKSVYLYKLIVKFFSKKYVE